MRTYRSVLVGWCFIALISVSLAPLAAEVKPAPGPRKIVLIAGQKSHGPGAHDYERTMRLFKVLLDNSNVADQVRVEVHTVNWPRDERTLDDADTIVFYSDGRDGTKFRDVPFVVGKRMETIDRQMRRGCGLVTIHFSTFVTDEEGERVLKWTGGYFDWQDAAGERNWFSRISRGDELRLASPEHAIARGVPAAVTVNDEVYWKLRFLPDDARLVPIWRAPALVDPDKTPLADVVAWAVEREDGGRGFGTSAGHSYRLWQDDGVRRLVLNAIVWTAQVEVPPAGVESKFYSDEEVDRALEGVAKTARAVVMPE